MSGDAGRKARRCLGGCVGSGFEEAQLDAPRCIQGCCGHLSLQALAQVSRWAVTHPLYTALLASRSQQQGGHGGNLPSSSSTQLSALQPQLLLCGHSRGGKIGTLAALQGREAGKAGDEEAGRTEAVLGGQVVGLVLLDPADSSFETVESPRFPSAVRQLGSTSGAGSPPVLVVGAARNGDCIPRKGNFAAFFEAAR